MYKKLCLLISFVFVLCICGTTQAQTDIDVNNWSFEWADPVNLVTCHQGLGDAPNEPVWGWTGGAWPGAANPTWSGVDINCGPDTCPEGDPGCKTWFVVPDGNVVAYFDDGTNGYQLTNQNITPGHMYTLTADLMTWWTEEGHVQPTRLQFYYLEDPCNPDANHIVLADKVYMVEGYQLESCAGKPDCRDDWQYDQKLQWVAQENQPYDANKLGIKIGSPPAQEYTGSDWAFADNIRLNWRWASSAYDPDPEDDETNVSKNPTLCWTPGLWTATTLGHYVYFGTDEAAVTDANTNSPEYTGAPQDSNCYTPSGPLELGKTYYWRVDEVNDNYSGPLPPPWKGDTWSFEIAGYALNPSPYNGETDIPYLDQLLMWTAGTDATSHDVYFGTDEEAVADANTNSSFEFRGNQALGDTDWPLPALDVSTTYFWRIDEVSTVHPTGLKGKVWSFMVGEFLILDDFDQYANLDPCMYAVWTDYNPSDSELRLQTGDMNYIHGGEGKSMQVGIDNTSKDGAAFRGSYVDCEDLTKLEAGDDWSIGGVKSLTMYLIGDPCNLPHVGVDTKDNPLVELIAPWLEVEDTSSNVGFVAYDSPSNMFYDYQWFEWNIDCNVFDACGVTLSAIDRLTIGFGGDKVGQGTTPTKNTTGYVHIDDLRLYPARCIPAKAKVAGNITEGDCVIDNFDMQIMAEDWLIPDGCFPTSQQNGTITMKVGDPNWCTGYDGNNALGFDPNIKLDVCDPGLMGLSNMSITAWVYREGAPEEGYIGIVTCREKGIEDSTELACGSSKTDPEVGYCWNQITATWQFTSTINIPDSQWMFMAMAVDPTGATLWGAPAGATLAHKRHSIELGPLEQFDEKFWIGRGRDDGRFFNGKIDDVRIFDKTLDGSEMAWLHTDGVDGNDPGCPAYHHKLDESSGLTAADSGCGAIVYRPVMSPANLTDPEPVMERFVNFRDFDIMATNWLEEYLWPEW